MRLCYGVSISLQHQYFLVNSLITPDEKAANERIDFSAHVTYYRWVMTNVPELKLENFTSSLMNHIARMDVQLAAQGKPLTPRTYRTSWPELINGLLKNEFAAKKSSVSIPDEVKNSVANLSSLEKVKEVSTTQKLGGRNRQVRVVLDKDKFMKYEN